MIAVNTPDSYPVPDTRAAGPFESEGEAAAFVREIADDAGIELEIVQLYEPERGVYDFAIGDR